MQNDQLSKLTPETFVFFLLVFTAVGVVFLFIHLLMGSVIRPSIPETEKLTIYECGEPTVGSAWVQFDLRYYVVALLFVIFDVEVAFFFPWATVYGKANELASLDEQRVVELSVADKDKRRVELSEQLLPSGMTPRRRADLGLEDSAFRWGGLELLTLSPAELKSFNVPVKEGLLVVGVKRESSGFKAGLKRGDVLVGLANKAVPTEASAFAELVNNQKSVETLELVVFRGGKKETIQNAVMPAFAQVPTTKGNPVPIESAAARSWAQIAFWDIAVFFGVLMVGFAYVWRRGDLNWVKTYAHHQEPAIEPEKPLEQKKEAAAPPPQPVSAH